MGVPALFPSSGQAMNQRELLQLIETARNNGSTVLDLGEKGLTALPPEIGQLTGILRKLASISLNSALTHGFGGSNP